MKFVISGLKWFLIAWGTLSLLAVIWLGLAIVWELGPGNRTIDDKASAKDVRFILNWCSLGDRPIEKVIHSHVSDRSFTGDHLDAYAIQLSHVSLEELNQVQNSSFGQKWYRGDQLPPVLDQAVSFVEGIHGEVPWFPWQPELKSDQVYVFPQSIYLYGTKPISVQLIFIRPSDKMVFYLDAKT